MTALKFTGTLVAIVVGAAGLGFGLSGLMWLFETWLNPGPVGKMVIFGVTAVVVVFLLALVFAKHLGDR